MTQVHQVQFEGKERKFQVTYHIMKKSIWLLLLPITLDQYMLKETFTKAISQLIFMFGPLGITAHILTCMLDYLLTNKQLPEKDQKAVRAGLKVIFSKMLEDILNSNFT